MKKSIITILGAVLLLAVSCDKAITVPETASVIPEPMEMTLGEDAFKVAGATFWLDARIDQSIRPCIEAFADRLSLVTGKKSRLVKRTGKSFVFILVPEIPKESYEIKVSPLAACIQASDKYGFLYAIQTICQMLPVEVYGNSKAPDANWALRSVTIKDQPRFAYRGMHLDCARHYFSIDEIKKYLDVMAIHKMNRFHWHLTEDQGWRIEIKKYPKLTEIGSVRHGTMLLKDWESNDGVDYGGFYTQDEAREIVAYAAERGITVIPEIDLPGHMLSALASYPELGCTGGPYEVWTHWGVSDQVLCPGKEATFEFIEGVLEEIMDIFPSEYIHIGGDECPKTQWAVCPDCQARIKELGLKSDRHASAETRLQNYVTARVQKFVNEHGRQIIGWDEILEGELAEGATVMSWRGVQGGIEAAKKGFDAIMTPSTYAYLDYYQTDSLDVEPLAIGGYLPLDKVYSYEPYEDIPEDAQHHILGVQANLWTEFISKPEHLEYMLLPRMDAICEVQWCQPEKKDYETFKKKLEHLCEIYDFFGYSWCKAVFGTLGLEGVPGGTN
ncbi:MAG: beta-N-acetylhexosaminidase [Candidatus Cryptobacteroides sp.]